MATTLNPYLTFPGTAAEAMAFYHHVLGGTLDSSTYGESGMGAPDEAHKIMHAQLTTEHGHTVMGADAAAGMPQPTPGAQQVSLSGDDESVLRRWWQGLADGATIVEDLQQAPWGDVFGMLTDRFGILWLVNITPAPTE